MKLRNTMPLSLSERERLAYASKDPVNLALFKAAVDMQEEISLHESTIDTLEKSSQLALDNHAAQLESAEEDLLEAQLQRDNAHELIAAMLETMAQLRALPWYNETIGHYQLKFNKLKETSL